VDLIFTEPHAVLPAWQVTAAALPGIDDHFWDWMLWLAAKQQADKAGLVAADLAKLHEHLPGTPRRRAGRQPGTAVDGGPPGSPRGAQDDRYDRTRHMNRSTGIVRSSACQSETL
jgi:hypothetical protein